MSKHERITPDYVSFKKLECGTLQVSVRSPLIKAGFNPFDRHGEAVSLTESDQKAIADFINGMMRAKQPDISLTVVNGFTKAN